MFNPAVAPYAEYYLNPFRAAAASFSVEAIRHRRVSGPGLEPSRCWPERNFLASVCLVAALVWWAYCVWTLYRSALSLINSEFEVVSEKGDPLILLMDGPRSRSCNRQH